MAKFKLCNEDQLVMLPISLQDQLAANPHEHTISHVVEKHINLPVFGARSSSSARPNINSDHANG